MFDRYVVEQAPNYPQTVNKTVKTTINENRAPTDHSVQLLSEMQEKAFESMLGKLKLESNLLEHVGVIASRDAMMYGSTRFTYQFDLNKERITGHVKIDDFEWYSLSEKEIIMRIRDGILENITHRIMLNVCSDPLSKKSINDIFYSKRNNL